MDYAGNLKIVRYIPNKLWSGFSRKFVEQKIPPFFAQVVKATGSWEGHEDQTTNWQQYEEKK